MSMMGKVKFFLGIQIDQSHQTKYTKDLLKKFKLDECKPMFTPMHPTCSLDKDESGKRIGHKTFKGMIESLLYLTASKSDILFSVYVLGFRLVGYLK